MNEIHFNTTHRLGIDRSFMGRNSRELKDQGKQLEKFQLVDLFRIKQEMIINKFFSPTISTGSDDAVYQLRSQSETLKIMAYQKPSIFAKLGFRYFT